MRRKDTLDVVDSLTAVAADTIAIFSGFLLATWIRFDSGWIPLPLGRPADLYRRYAIGIAVATFVFVAVYRALGLYLRPQLGRFEDKIPRLVRATGLGLMAAMVLAFVFKNVVEYSTVVLLLSLPSIALLVLVERYALFRTELHFARHSPVVNRVLILGVDEVAARLKRALEREPKLRSRVAGFLRTDSAPPHADIPGGLIVGTVNDLARAVEHLRPVDQVILTNSAAGYSRIVEIILFCEKNMIAFNMVPDLFRILIGNMDVQAVGEVPLLGVARWPLDLFWNRVAKRAEDVVGGVFGLLLSAPAVAAAAVLIKRDSPGPVFFRQARCGEHGKVFTIYKLRTMPVDAEAGTGPVFATKDDLRPTRIGAFLRRHSLDELPQFWNVLKGDMSLVGPRPERPHFVEKFKEGVARYMWRHMCRPGLTGWAQVNGLRGDTSIEDRVKYDLYYLENWSLALDFKILVKTLLARENAY